MFTEDELEVLKDIISFAVSSDYLSYMYHFVEDYPEENFTDEKLDDIYKSIISKLNLDI